MAPTKARNGSSKGTNKRSTKPTNKDSNSRIKKATSSKKPAPKPVQQKTKSTALPARKKKRTYTDKELGISSLNSIVPAGVQKQPNAKKGKKFVDDKESMNAILAIVMAEKEGNIESQMMRSRHLEEVREARRIEAEKRVASKKQDLEVRKDSIKEDKKMRRRGGEGVPASRRRVLENDGVVKKPKKRVSFG